MIPRSNATYLGISRAFHNGDSARPSPSNDEEYRLEPEPELTDAKAMRALAHPVRLSLIDLLGYHEALTATKASELLGESPSNCAFHLRTLAKYGFLREAAADNRRERPWTLVHRGVRINSRQADPQAALAAGALARAALDRWLSRAVRVFGSPNRVPGWDGVQGWSRANLFMTRDEALAAREEIDKVLHRYEARTANPALRPAGAHPVEWATFAAPIAEWAPDGIGPSPNPDGESEP